MSSKNRGSMPRLKYLAGIHPRLYLCRNAALMRLSGGLDRLVYACPDAEDDGYRPRETYGVYLNGVPLVDAYIPGCGTCGPFLHKGYGDGLVHEAECNAVRDQINAGYSSLKESVGFLAPIIGLMKSGLYLVADFDLFHVEQYGENDFGHSGDELHFEHCYSGGSECHHQPMFLVPSQRASQINAARVDEYRRRIQEGDSFPRAIALYLNGGMALLLDGHHKAVACAAEGVPAKTLVIFQAEPEKTLKAALDSGRRLYLHDEINHHWGVPPLEVRDGDGVRLAGVRCMQSVENAFIRPQKLEKVPWGCLSDEYPTERFMSFRPEGMPTADSVPPPDQIRSLIAEEMKKGRGEYDMSVIEQLRRYAEMFPESKWLSASERAWLNRDYGEFFFPMSHEVYE